MGRRGRTGQLAGRGDGAYPVRLAKKPWLWAPRLPCALFAVLAG